MVRAVPLLIALAIGALAALLLHASARRHGPPATWAPAEDRGLVERDPWPLVLLALAPLLGLLLVWALGAADLGLSGLIWGAVALAVTAVGLSLVCWPDWL